MKRAWIAALLLLPAVACSAERDAAYQTAVDSLSRRQKDSLVSTMPVPGASGVGRALQAVDDANARTQAHDTIR